MEETGIVKKKSISEKFSDRRAETSKNILEIIELMYDLKNLRDAQVQALSLRQKLLEDNHTLLDHLIVIKRRLREEKGNIMQDISQNIQTRYGTSEKTVVIDGRTANTREVIELFENQINFFADSIKTVDNIIFGFKTRLDIDKTLGV